jgi:hypothetical protein
MTAQLMLSFENRRALSIRPGFSQWTLPEKMAQLSW